MLSKLRPRIRISPASTLIHAAVGVYGEARPREQVLKAGDRVEIYRALAVDPKAARRARAKQARRGH